jgi:hypothetical protein
VVDLALVVPREEHPFGDEIGRFFFETYREWIGPGCFVAQSVGEPAWCIAPARPTPSRMGNTSRSPGSAEADQRRPEPGRSDDRWTPGWSRVASMARSNSAEG